MRAYRLVVCWFTHRTESPVSDYIEKIATDEQRKQGLDVADFFLMKPTAHEVMANMIKRNPAVGLLIEKLDLEVCDNEPQDGVP